MATLLNGSVLSFGDKQLSWCTKLKYLGCIFLDGSCEIDISPSVGKFYAQFNNIMAVLGKYNNEMAAVHLTNSYCVPSLLYACEIWSLRKSSAHSVRVALNNSFRRIFNCCCKRTQSLCCFIAEPCQLCTQLTSVVYLLFYEKLKHNSNILIRTIARLCQHDILSVAAKLLKYGIYRLDNSVSVIKKSVWKTFAASAV